MAVFLMGLQVATDRCAMINDRSDAPARPRLWVAPSIDTARPHIG